ncbi:dynamin family protein [Burkholderia gladioli]|uniref:dynamin family protein n=1 Tax=Burkholderia gladioli TaxID=28095 RepID=UPI001FC857C8|nr:dynamin family protein [Burkholderia gladioli]
MKGADIRWGSLSIDLAFAGLARFAVVVSPGPGNRRGAAVLYKWKAMKRAPVRETRTYRRASVPAARAGFEILVMATVSAGKSSVINALIGQELLHAANEATTACITRVEHRRDHKSFTGACYRGSGTVLAPRREATPELLRQWNADSRVERIALTGRFEGVPRLASGLVLYDTPGPNNSQDDRHAQVARKALRSIPYDALFYVLNAGQLGTTDDRACLDLLRGEARANQPYFLLNKIDLLDAEKGEDLATHVGNARRYLAGAGFDDAIVIPTVADAALYARKALNGHALTRVQRGRLRNALDAFEVGKRDVAEAAIVPDPVRTAISGELDRHERDAAVPPGDARSAERHALEQLVARSGIRTAEALIQHRRSLLGQ